MKKRHRKLLQFIAGYAATHPTPPTQEECADHLGVSTPTVCRDLKKLESDGYVRREEYKSKAVEILQMPEDEDAA